MMLSLMTKVKYYEDEGKSKEDDQRLLAYVVKEVLIDVMY